MIIENCNLQFFDCVYLRKMLMPVSYNKLWKILEERKMLKTDLIKAAGISTNAMAKLGKDEDVRVGVLIKICKTLDCKLDDIMDII